MEADLQGLTPAQQTQYMDQVEAQFPPDAPEAPAAPPPSLTEPPNAWERGIALEKQRFSDMTGGFADQAPGALLGAVKAIPQAVGAVAGFPQRLIDAGLNPRTKGVELIDDAGNMASGLASGAKDYASKILGFQGARGTGEAIAETVPGMIPVGGIMGKVASGMKSSRINNLIRAVGETSLAGKANIEKLASEGRLNPPIALTRGSLKGKVDDLIATEGPELQAAKDALDTPAGTGPVPLDEFLKSLKNERPGTPLLRQGPKGPYVVDLSGNPALVSAIDTRINQLIHAAGYEKSIPAGALQKFKEEAQDAASAAYRAAEEAGETSSASAKASEIAASSVKQALETSSSIPAAIRDRLTAANRTMEPLLAMQKPMEARRLGARGKLKVSRSAEMLAGRFALPVALGATGFGVAGPLGAAAGLTAGAFMQSALWNTLSAAAKKQVALVLEREGVQAAVQASFRTLIAEQALRGDQPPSEATP
jgi:hypothetical protein